MVVSIDGEANWLVISLTVILTSGVMLLGCVSCKCWRRFVKKDASDDEGSNAEGEVYTNPSFDDVPKTSTETKRKKFSSVVTNSPNNAIEPYQEVAEGVVLQNRFTKDKKENEKQLNEVTIENGDIKDGKVIDKSEQISQSEHSYSSNIMSKPADAISNSSTIVVSVEVHCASDQNGHLGMSPLNSKNCSPKQRSIAEEEMMDCNDLEYSTDKNGIAVHINQFAVERLEEKMKDNHSLQNEAMGIAL